MYNLKREYINHKDILYTLIKKYKNNIRWSHIDNNEMLTDKYHDTIDWYWLSKNPSLKLSTIYKYFDKKPMTNIWENKFISDPRVFKSSINEDIESRKKLLKTIDIVDDIKN